MPQNLSPTSIADTPTKRERPKGYKRRTEQRQQNNSPSSSFPLAHKYHYHEFHPRRVRIPTVFYSCHDPRRYHCHRIYAHPLRPSSDTEDAIQVPSLFLYNTYSPSDSDDLWASMPPIEKEPKTYRKIWGYGVNDKEVFIWITVDGRWLCEE